MSKYKFGTVSTIRLESCHNDLQIIMRTALSVSDIDFGIAEGHRSIKDQQKYFKEGKSKIDGINKIGKHNYTPSLAVDIYPYVEGRAVWGKEHLCYLAGLIKGVSELLYQHDLITYKVRWGGNWDMDGEILTDQSFDDLPHFELINR